MTKADVVRFTGNRRPVRQQEDCATIVILPVVYRDEVQTIRLSRDDLVKLEKLGRIVEGRVKSITKNGKGVDITLDTKTRA